MTNRETLYKRTLTDRQRDVLEMVALGYTDNEIAGFLGIKSFTVKQHVKAILVKLDARNRAHAVYIAVGDGILI